MPDIYLPVAPEGLYEHTAKRGEDFLLGLRPPRTLNSVMAANRLSSAATGTGFQPVQAPAPVLQPVPDAATQGGQVVSTRAGLIRIPWPQPAAPQPVPILPAPDESLASQVAQARVTNAPVDLGGGMAQYGPRIRGGVVPDTGAPARISIPQAGPVSQGLLQPVPDAQFRPATGQDLTKFAGSAAPMPAITPAMVAPQARPATAEPTVSLPVAPAAGVAPTGQGVSGAGLPTGPAEGTVQIPGLLHAPITPIPLYRPGAGGETGGVVGPWTSPEPPMYRPGVPMEPAMYPPGTGAAAGGAPAAVTYTPDELRRARVNKAGADAVNPREQSILDAEAARPATERAAREAAAAKRTADAKALTLSREDVTRADQEIGDLERERTRLAKDEEDTASIDAKLSAAKSKRDALIQSRRSALGAGGELGQGNVDIRGLTPAEAPMVRPPLTPAMEKALPSMSATQAKQEENDITDLLYGKKIVNPLGVEERVPGFLKITQTPRVGSDGKPIIDESTGQPRMKDVVSPATADTLDQAKAAMVARLARDKKFGKVADAQATYALVRWMVQAENNNESFKGAIKDWKEKNAGDWKKYSPAITATPATVGGAPANGPVGPQGQNVGSDGQPVPALGNTGFVNKYNAPVVKPNDARHGYVAPAPNVTEAPKTVDVTPGAAPVAPTPITTETLKTTAVPDRGTIAGLLKKYGNDARKATEAYKRGER